jgi:outer membrane cobalamin receptor
MGKKLLVMLLSSTIFVGASFSQNITTLSDTLYVKGDIVQTTSLDNFSAEKSQINPNQIDNLNPNDVASLLRRIPGVSYSRYNHIGSFGGADGGSIFIRGIGSSRPGSELTTYIDDVPVYMSIWNHPLLDVLPLFNSSTIEIYKGPHPQSYPNTFSSVNILTTPLVGENRTESMTTYGSYNLFSFQVVNTSSFGKLEVGINTNFTRSDGHRENSDGRLGAMFGKVRYNLTEHSNIEFSTLYTDNYSQDPGPVGNPNLNRGTYETSSLMNSLSLNRKTGYIKMYRSSGTGDWLGNLTREEGVREFLYNEFEFYGVRAKEDVGLFDFNKLVVGFNYDISEGQYRQELTSGQVSYWNGPVFRLFSPHVGLVNEFNVGSASVVPSFAFGMRAYGHSHFDSEISPYYGANVKYGKTKVGYSYAKGVRYPGLEVVVFSERVIPPLGDSWESLIPENLTSRNFFFGGNIGRVDYTLSYFNMVGENRYIILPGSPPSYQSIGEYDINGLEVGFDIYLSNLISSYISATYIETNPYTLPYTPNWSVYLALLFDLNRINVMFDVKYSDEYYTSSFGRNINQNINVVTDQILSSLNVSYEINRNFGIFTKVDNLFNESFEYVEGYSTPSRNYKAGVRSRF